LENDRCSGGIYELYVQKSANQDPFLQMVCSYSPVCSRSEDPFLCAMIAIVIISGLLTQSAHADGYPPYWDNSTNAVHFAPAAWPSDSAWIPYTYQGVGIKDQRTQDPSNGGTSPQNYVNVSSQCTDQLLPSIAWYFDSTKMFFSSAGELSR